MDHSIIKALWLLSGQPMSFIRLINPGNQITSGNVALPFMSLVLLIGVLNNGEGVAGVEIGVRGRAKGDSDLLILQIGLRYYAIWHVIQIIYLYRIVFICQTCPNLDP